MKDLITKLAAYGSSVDSVGTDKSANALATTLPAILNNIIAVLGLVCVVVIIIGGVNYMTSGGDSGKVKTAKNTILYGLIGLVICVLAFAIVNWLIMGVLGNS